LELIVELSIATLPAVTAMPPPSLPSSPVATLLENVEAVIECVPAASIKTPPPMAAPVEVATFESTVTASRLRLPVSANMPAPRGTLLPFRTSTPDRLRAAAVPPGPRWKTRSLASPLITGRPAPTTVRSERTSRSPSAARSSPSAPADSR
jgi:hypothetical protein